MGHFDKEYAKYLEQQEQAALLKKLEEEKRLMYNQGYVTPVGPEEADYEEDDQPLRRSQLQP